MNDNKKIAVNSIVIFIRLCVVTFVSIYASRIILDALGASDFGLYNVVGGVVAVLNIVNAAMMSTTYRYLAYEIGKGEKGQPNRIFNTSMIIHVAFALLILTIGWIVGEWYVNHYLNVEVGKIDDAKFVFRLSIVTTAISTMFVPYQGLQVAYERFAVNACIDILSQIAKLAALLVFIYDDGNRLRIYAIIMLAFNMLYSFMYAGYCFRNYYSVVKIKIYKDLRLIKEMIGFASWTMVGAVANIGKDQGSAIIINLFFGTIINAAYAVACQVGAFINMFARTLNSAAIPQITKNFSGGNLNRSITLTAYISKYTFILMTLVAFPVLVEMDFLLGLWLKEVPAGASIFCQILILTGLLSSMGEGIPAMINATGKIRSYQIVVNLTLLSGLPIGYLCYELGADYYALSVVYCAIFGFIGFLKIYMLHRVVDFEIQDFFKISYSKILFVSIPLVVYFFIYDSKSFPVLGHFLGLIGAEMYLLFDILLFGLDKKEKRIIAVELKKIKNKIV